MRKLNFLFYYCLFLGIVSLLGGCLFGFGVFAFDFNLETFLFFIIEFILIVVLAVSVYFYNIRRKKRIQMLKIKNDKKDKENLLLNLYDILGIPPQRKKDGSLMNIYELLGIKPQYDKNGIRIPTIYEMLNVLPLLDSNYNEIPNVVFIKNYTKKIATLKQGSSLLKLTSKNGENVNNKEENKSSTSSASNKKTDSKKKKTSASSSNREKLVAYSFQRFLSSVVKFNKVDFYDVDKIDLKGLFDIVQDANKVKPYVPSEKDRIRTYVKDEKTETPYGAKDNSAKVPKKESVANLSSIQCYVKSSDGGATTLAVLENRVQNELPVREIDSSGYERES